MADCITPSWPPGTFLDAATFGVDRRFSVDPFGSVLWPANALGCPNDIVAAYVATALVQAPIAAVDPDNDPLPIVPPAGWIAYGHARTSAWNGGGSD